MGFFEQVTNWRTLLFATIGAPSQRNTAVRMLPVFGRVKMFSQRLRYHRNRTMQLTSETIVLTSGINISLKVENTQPHNSVPHFQYNRNQLVSSHLDGTVAFVFAELDVTVGQLLVTARFQNGQTLEARPGERFRRCSESARSLKPNSIMTWFNYLSKFINFNLL